MSTPRGVALELDGVFGDTRPLWRDWLASAAPVLGVEPDELADDRAAAAVELDRRGAGNWRVLLERFCEERAPVYVRRDPGSSAALKALRSAGHRLAVSTDAPEPLARVVLSQLGADRRVELVQAGRDARRHAHEALGKDAVVVTTRDELERVLREGT